MEDAAKRDASRRARLLRQANRLQVLVDLVKATSDSLADGLAPGNAELPFGSAAAPESGVPGVLRNDSDERDRCDCGHARCDHVASRCAVPECTCRGFRWFGGKADTSRPQGPAEASTTNGDIMSRPTITRGTVLGMLDRLDDALERDEKLGAQTAALELRHLVDDLPL